MRARLFLLLVLIVGFTLMRESDRTPLSDWNAAYASWLRVNAPVERGERDPLPVVLVEINDEELRTTAWPWSPFDFSVLVNAALTFDPGVLAIEPLLAWPDATEQQVALLHHQLLRVPKLILAAELGVDDNAEPELRELPVLARTVKAEDINGLPDFTHLVHAPTTDLKHAGALGAVNLADTRTGNIPLALRNQGQMAPSFVLQVAMAHYRLTPEDVTVIPGFQARLGKVAQIPIGRDGTMNIDFSAPFTRFAASDLVLAAEQRGAGRPTLVPTELMKGAIVLIGRTDVAERKLEYGGRLYSPGELFARSLATILHGEFPYRASTNVNWAILVVGGLLAVVSLKLGKLGNVALSVLIGAAYALISLGLFSSGMLIMPFVLPFGLLTVIALGRLLA